MKNNLYKNIIIYELADDLMNIDCLLSNFVLNWKEYMEDEEYIKNDIFIKCPYCNSENTKKIYVQNRDFSNFIKKYNISYSTNTAFDNYSYLKHTLELMTILDNYANICFCDNCKKIILANDRPFFFNYHLCASDYERLYISEGLMSNIKKPIYCSSCNSKNFFSEQDYERDNIEHIYCVRCKNYICDKDTTSNKYYINMNYFRRKFS